MLYSKPPWGKFGGTSTLSQPRVIIACLTESVT